MLKKNNQIIIVIKMAIAILVAILSFTLISKVASSSEFHKNSIEALDQKKITIMELTAGAATVAASASLILGERSEPISNKLMDLTGYFILILSAIILEKYLLTILGLASFKIILPIASLIYIIFLFTKNNELKKISIKLALFSILVFLVIPSSVAISNLIEKTYSDEINIVIRNAKNITEEAKVLNENNLEISNDDNYIFDSNINNDDLTDDKDILSKAKSIFDNAKNTISNTAKKIGGTIVDNAKNFFDEATRIIGNLIEAIAIMIVTTCVIPLIVLFLFIYVIKLFFNIDIKIPDKK